MGEVDGVRPDEREDVDQRDHDRNELVREPEVLLPCRALERVSHLGYGNKKPKNQKFWHGVRRYSTDKKGTTQNTLKILSVTVLFCP